MPKPEKYFCEYRNEATDPFVQLYYDILSRFHVNDYNKALEGMSDKMRQIIMACSNELNNEEFPTTLTQADLDNMKENLDKINARIFEICKLAGCVIDDFRNLNIYMGDKDVFISYPCRHYMTDYIVEANYRFPIDWLLKTDAEIKNLAKAHNAEIIKERYGIADNRDNDDFPF
jgi:hypothetical protein